MSTTMQAAPAHTPWGAPHRVTEIAPGITSYTTASHGGMHLSVERRLQMPAPLRAHRPWAGAGWYEEDCDWALVALAWPEHFTAHQVTNAYRLLAGWQPGLRGAFYTEAPEDHARVLEIVSAWERDHAEHWERTGASASGHGWMVDFRRVRDGAYETRPMTSDEYFACPLVVAALPGRAA